MKKNKNRLSIFWGSLLVLTFGCTDLLEETPRTQFTTKVYESVEGLQGGLATAYTYLRYHYGTNPSLGLNVTGTDEYTFGPEPNRNGSGDNLPHKTLGTYDVQPSAGYLTTTFNRTFPIINMLNGMLASAEAASGVSEVDRLDIMAQSRYLRAHFYYLLVGQFGAVPIDLGSGDLVFNGNPFTGFNRLDPDLLEKNYQIMIDDLTYAVENLKLTARPTTEFRLSKAVALHLLSKIYLYRAYSSVSQSTDFENAYNTAMELINNQAAYGTGLNQFYGRIFEQDYSNGNNDYNFEILFAAERIPLNQIANGYTNGSSGIGDAENMAANCFTSNYEQPQLLSPANGDPIDGRPFTFQRPLRKLTPTPWLLNTAFADKDNDSRYHNSFRTLYTSQSENAPGTAGYQTFVTNLANMGRQPGDTAFYLADSQAQADAINATNPYYRVYAPNVWYTNQLYPASDANPVLVYPSLKKFDDFMRATRNDASGRPMPIFRLAETYLNAAEAAFQMGNTGDAVDLINVIRRRAAYRPSRPGMDATENATANTNAIAAMEITAGQIDLDFILDERARELCGEGVRWTDLAARGAQDPSIFINRIKLNPDAQAVDAHHILRPIPQGQLDALEDPNKAQYQNPGYNN